MSKGDILEQRLGLHGSLGPSYSSASTEGSAGWGQCLWSPFRTCSPVPPNMSVLGLVPCGPVTVTSPAWWGLEDSGTRAELWPGVGFQQVWRGQGRGQGQLGWGWHKKGRARLRKGGPSGAPGGAQRQCHEAVELTSMLLSHPPPHSKSNFFRSQLILLHLFLFLTKHKCRSGAVDG